MRKSRFVILGVAALIMTGPVTAADKEDETRVVDEAESAAVVDEEAAASAQNIERPKRAPASFGVPEGVVERETWFYHQRAYPLREIPQGARQRGLDQAALAPTFKKSFPSGPLATETSIWEELGPVGFTSSVEPTWGNQSGRVRALAIDPSNTDRLFLGTATGGVWSSTDGGTNWTPLTDTQETLAIGAVAIDLQSTGNNTIYVGTGEGNGSYYGVGILKSTDGGTNWSTLNPGDIFTRGQIVDIHVDPIAGGDDPIVVCAKSGSLLLAEPGQVGGNVGPIYRSTDGGTTFAGPLGPTCFCTELQVDPSDFDNQYMSATTCADDNDNGIWKSTDAGATWTQLAGGAPSGAGVARRAIGISSDGLTIYVGGGAAGANEIHKSTDAGANWTLLAPTTSGGFGSGEASNYCEGQCDYDNHVTVNPNDASDVFLGGVGLYRSTDGGVTFSRPGANNDGGGPLHVDHHEMKYVPGTSGATTGIYSGNDGGIYRSTDNGATWTALGATLSTIQAYHVALHPTDAGILFQGNQDNGTTRRTTSNTTWTERTGGDGSFAAISHAEPMTVYTSSASLGGPNISTDGGENFGDASTGLPDEATDRRNFIAPIVLDTSNTNAAVDDTLYAGTYRLWRTTDEGANWLVRSGDLTGGDLEANVTNIAIAPSNNQVIYATTSNGKVQRSADAGQTFTDTTKAPLPGRYATSVAVHPTDPDTAYVTFSGFNDSTPGSPGHVFKTTDAGTTWADVSGAVPPGGGLPDLPMSTMAIRPDVPTEIYAGTDAGVFISTTGGTTWAKMTGGIPNVGIQTLAVNGTTNLLVAATYGRSTWKTSLSGAVNTAPSIISGGGGPTAAVNAAENQTAVTDVQSTDPEGDTEGSGLTYGLTGGADQTKFSIDMNSGVLTFIAAPDFEVPGDANGDNDYEVQVTVTDSGGLTDLQDITVTVTDVSEGGCPSTITRSNETLSGTQTLQATTSITLGPNLIIDGDNIVALAPSVIFENGVEISPIFSAGNNPVCP